ncbi:hypothetical protein ABZ816_15450 [Actinosynnema sp. NPDC047251]|uniref:Putative secreted protein n=1 Tax=Saccharothrix espanaensis (strain ATCC 51144 / DSM 44229 / JCM 9112 / NBRC 15066 / NRRL 15764) TaxID=1179773 RepID=K0JQH9_SACES|nr:hypothetical protein [Saccharothrix espanaensis]CCH29585.1 putative secreted protein [Saccharothrix espanaensis DSM 44229]
MIGKAIGVGLAAVFATAALVTPAQAGPSHWSCRSVPAGYTYTMVRADVGCEPLYYVTLPETGLWACTVPAGFTYTATRNGYSCAYTPTPSTQYLLAKL